MCIEPGHHSFERSVFFQANIVRGRCHAPLTSPLILAQTFVEVEGKMVWFRLVIRRIQIQVDCGWTTVCGWDINLITSNCTLKALTHYTPKCKDFIWKIMKIFTHISNCWKSRCSCKKVVVCMEDKCIFCSFVCIVEGHNWANWHD